MVEIRRVGAEEGPLLRVARLRALAESPRAFVSTLAEERSLDPQQWAVRAAEAATGTEQVVILAVADGGAPIGMAGGRVREPGVISHVPEAAGFYRRVGFACNGGSRPLSRDPARSWHEMTRAL